MKTVKSRYIKKGISKGERIKIKELNTKEQEEQGNYKYIITLGEYDDIDHECDSLNEAIEFFNDYENN